MKKFYPYVIFVIAIFSKNLTYAQCSSASATIGAFINPTSTWLTQATTAGRFHSFNGIAGVRYIFSFCQAGGTASFDTEISINTSTGAVMAGAYNDDNCGTRSEYTFVPATTGTYRIYITKYGCASSGEAGTFAYRMITHDNVCEAYPLSSTSCGCTYYTFTNEGATSSPQTSPSCGNYTNNDVWFKTSVPFSGQLKIEATAGVMTDGAMSVYRSSNNTCSGALTQIGCDDNNGTGNMPVLNFTSLTPGDSIFVRFWAKNGSETGTFNICVQDPAPLFCMSGNAGEIYPSKCVQITPGKTGQAGCVWNNSKINLGANFDYTFTVNLGSNDATGADGITFALQDSPSGTSACGTTGQGLGMGGVTRSVTVEFDTFDNSGMGYTEISADHIAVSLNGNIGTPVAGPVQASLSSVNIEDGANHTVRIVWTQSTKVFDIYFDGNLRLSYVNDLVTNVFTGTNNVYWGMTGSTGLYYNQQTLCPGNLPGSPLPLTFFNGFLKNENDVEFVWTYVNTYDARKFTIEHSANGTDYTQVYQNESITPAAFNRYSWTMGDSDGGYFRLIVDKKDGSQETSSVVYIDMDQLQHKEYQIFPNPGQSSEMNIMSNESGDAQVVIRNVIGEIVSTHSISGVVNTLILPDNMTNGSYIVTIATANKAYNYHYTLLR